MLSNLDLIVAVVLLLIAGLVFLLLKMHVLPVKGVPYVVGALAALAGFSIFKAHRASKLSEKIAQQKKELDARREVLKKLADEKRISEQQYHEARSKLDEYEASFLKSSALLRAEDEQRRQAIEAMSIDEVNKTLGLERLPAGTNP